MSDAATDHDAARYDGGLLLPLLPPVDEVPDERAPCADRDPLRRPLFGDLHVHTTLSMDARIFETRTGPSEALAFARGMPLELPPYDADGRPARTIRLDRPLDFAAVTDHSEFLAETSICHDTASPGWASATCQSYRMGTAVDLDFGELLASIGVTRDPTMLCRSQPELCAAARDAAWQITRDAAEAHYDRSSDCSFTSFVGYEWTATPVGNNLHRNVIFRSASVPRHPLSALDVEEPEDLWDALDRGCNDTGTTCRAIAIPHNPNVGGGMMFDPMLASGALYSAEDAERRARLEPIVEMYQHKGASECLPPALDPLRSEDDECAFEQLATSLCTGAATDAPDCRPDCADPHDIGFASCVARSDSVRGALGAGLLEWQRVGANPFAFGMIASTDTHKSNAGDVGEGTWAGHAGEFDTDARERVGFMNNQGSLDRLSPGGLAVVWAEENTREAIFDAMSRRETYATSGTRMVLRFFGGWSFAPALCMSPDLVSTGYASGVPMGSVLPPPAGAAAPTFVVSAMRDAMAAPLSTLQIVKGWVEGGEVRERVYDVASAGSADVDLGTCDATGAPGADGLCTVWTDPDFDAAVPAFYYVRALEDPTCRWHWRICVDEAPDCATLPTNDPLAVCCRAAGPPRTLRERAWSSPVWYLP